MKNIEVLTAKDARSITEYGATLDSMREYIYSTIKETAENGGFEVRVYLNFLPYIDKAAIIKELHDLGYSVEEAAINYIISW